MRIGVLSDTHIPKASQDLPKAIYKEFEKVDLILHAGDFAELYVLEKLRKIAPVRAVFGNMDSGELREELPKKDVITIGEFRIGLIHGYGPPKGIIKYVKEEFSKNIDVLIYGHSHMPCNEMLGETLFFNPGSPTDKVFAPYNSYGILEIDNEIKGKIVKLP